MQIKIFTIPIIGCEIAESNLNKFLNNNKILAVEQSIATSAGDAFWSFCIRYLEKGNQEGGLYKKSKNKAPRKDYKNELSEQEFSRFTFLRSIRKQIAQEDAIPAFAVFTDAELSALARLESQSQAAWAKIRGIGPKKIEKYHNKFVALLKKEHDEKDRTAAPKDS